MSNRLAYWKKSLVLLSLGGSSFALLLGQSSSALISCDRNLQNADLVTFFQGMGGAVIKGQVDDAFDDAKAAGNIGTDFDKWFRDPLTKIGQAYWNNYVFLHFPQDPSKVAVVKP